MVNKYNNLQANAANRKVSAGIDGVSKEIIKIANMDDGKFFTDAMMHGYSRQPNMMNNILRDLSSHGLMSTVRDVLSEFGTVDSDGGIVLGSGSNRLCGIGQTLEDVLSRGYSDGKKHPDIDKAIKEIREGKLSKFKTSWTASAWDARNATDDWIKWGQGKVWPTGNVVAGDKYYYIEVANDPSDHDESCWFKVERNKLNNGGIHPVLSSVQQGIDDEFLHKYSHTNVIGNQQSVVQKYNK